jgi:hypothetical protein
VDRTFVQVRDVPVSVIAALKARAEARGISLSAFLRDLMASEAAMPAIDEAMYVALAESLGLACSPTTPSSPQPQGTPRESPSTPPEIPDPVPLEKGSEKGP